jgi:hypothetical protein|tara:strand:+ start:12 stop:860 length:849 start_codon:yes stop_codon:yes gene_type:complete
MYFCTAADSNHYPVLLNQIGSIFKHNEKDLKNIAVFNLGLKPEEIATINSIDRVEVFEVEKTNPLITESIHCNNGRWIAGLFSWKPVVIKKSLEMFPYVLYMDSGTMLMNPANDLFDHIKENNYFVTDCGHSIKWMTPKYIINKLNLESDETKWILDDDTLGIDAGFQGVSREMLDSYIMPLYEMSKEIQNFLDDGTCPDGLGTARHDQPLFSIQARKLGLDILKHDRDPEECILTFDNKKVPLHITHFGEKLKPETVIWRCRRNISREILNESMSHIKVAQ